MDDNSRRDIRGLLKTFGVRADEAIVAHLARNPGVGGLRLKVTLSDLTDYGDQPPAEPLSLEVDGDINR